MRATPIGPRSQVRRVYSEGAMMSTGEAGISNTRPVATAALALPSAPLAPHPAALGEPVQKL